MKKIKHIWGENRAPIFISSMALLIAGATFFISLFIRGYRPSFRKPGLLAGTGLLSATSYPQSASVYLNGRLITATNDTVSLSPGTYEVKIAKDGFLPWEKTIEIKNEVVFQTTTQLFRSVPDLKPLTLSGATNPVSSPDMAKIVYSVASASAEADNGLYLLEYNSTLPLPTRPSIKQLSPNLLGINWHNAKFVFSPDSKKILAYFQTASAEHHPIFSPEWEAGLLEAYLVDPSQPVNLRSLVNVTPRVQILAQEWKELADLAELNRKQKIPEPIRPLFATGSASMVLWSPDEHKIAYVPTKDYTIPEHIITPPPAQSTQTQTRTVKPGHVYVYDIEEDTNFELTNTAKLEPNPSLSTVWQKPWIIYWLPTNTHLVWVESGEAMVVEYDNTNKHSLFTTAYEPTSTFLSPDGEKLIVLTTAYSNIPNLYAISIR